MELIKWEYLRAINMELIRWDHLLYAGIAFSFIGGALMIWKDPRRLKKKSTLYLHGLTILLIGCVMWFVALLNM